MISSGSAGTVWKLSSRDKIHPEKCHSITTHSSPGAVLEAVRLVLGLHMLPGGVLEPFTMQRKSWGVSQKVPTLF